MHRARHSRISAILLLLLSVPALGGYRFDLPETYLAEASALPAWAHTLERHADERSIIEDCLADEAACDGRLRALALVIQKGADLKPDDQLRLVNRYINKRRYRRDRRQLSLSVAEGGEARLRNQWSTLLEFLGRGGDCEDYATAKYFLLRELGYQAEDMRVVVSYDRSVRAHHAVLAIRRPDGSSWLLESDNTIRKTRQGGYRFIYAINENGIWDHEE
ncbi:MAG: transglutaminase-like cysteine peptidase [Gammaproteobacteria bacterium]|nr:transglutaminase-like cysteine peptidase [Gammaproteobacteria bacterium]